jgi:RNA polymerase sigma factor (sigma-70 family)
MSDPAPEHTVDKRACGPFDLAQGRPEDDRMGGAADARAALDGAVSQYETPLLRYVGQLLGRGTAHEAEDVVQETFLRYYREASRDGAAARSIGTQGRPAFGSEAQARREETRRAVRNVSTWLFRVAHNLTMDSLRRQARQSKSEAWLGGASPDQPDALEKLAHRESCDEALAELHRLPEEQRQVLLLRVVQGMKLREISEVTGLTVGNAGYRISEGLQELARRLKARGVI